MLTIAMDILVNSLYETLVLFPYLYLTYIALEYLEHKTTTKTLNIIKQSGKYGAIVGGLLGLIPQCGFSVAAANLYVTKVITLGALIAVFLSTSDEMLPLLISGGAGANVIILIMGFKIIFAVAAGILIDLFLPQKFIYHKIEPDVGAFCKREKCDCEAKEDIWRSAFKHTEKISLYIFVFSLLVNAAFAIGGRETFESVLNNYPIISKFAAAAVGLIPSCYPSVLLTQLYLENAISLSTMLAGTFSNAGLGLLVLYRLNPNKDETGRIALLLYGVSVVLGIICEIIL